MSRRFLKYALLLSFPVNAASCAYLYAHQAKQRAKKPHPAYCGFEDHIDNVARDRFHQAMYGFSVGLLWPFSIAAAAADYLKKEFK